jgi:hypothetical protein
MASGRGDLPHDLAQFVVESTLELHHGFWGLLANGAGTTTPAAPRRGGTPRGVDDPGDCLVSPAAVPVAVSNRDPDH